MLEAIKARIAEIEAAIQQVVGNHTSLVGRLDEAKVMLDMATKVAGEVLPGNPVVAAAEAVDSVVDELCAAVPATSEQVPA